MAETIKYSRNDCKYTEAKVEFIDYLDTAMLKHALSERFKIMPRLLTGTSKKYPEMVEVAIKPARHESLSPYIVDRKEVVNNPIEGL